MTPQSQAQDSLIPNINGQSYHCEQKVTPAASQHGQITYTQNAKRNLHRLIESVVDGMLACITRPWLSHSKLQIQGSERPSHTPLFKRLPLKNASLHAELPTLRSRSCGHVRVQSRSTQPAFKSQDSCLSEANFVLVHQCMASTCTTFAQQNYSKQQII